ALSRPEDMDEENLGILLDYSQSMARVLDHMEQYEEAMTYANAALYFERQRAETARTKTVGDARLLFEIKQKEDEVTILENTAALASQTAAIQTLRAREARSRLGLISMAAIATLIAAILLYRGYRSQQRLAHLRQLFLVETNHRAKNNLQMITSLLNMERRRQARSGDATAGGDDFSDRAQALALIHEHLYEHSDALEIKAQPFLNDLLDFLDRGLGRPDITIKREIEPIELDLDQATQIGLLTCEVVTSAFKHAFKSKGGEITVSLSETKNGLDLSIRDNGVGLNQQASYPDDDGSSGGLPKSTGLQLIESLAEQLNGTLKIISNTHGTQTHVERISLPNFSV
ncbi:MAG: sensor histidine kinase, partial [Pseudomonadota bacterium]